MTEYLDRVSIPAIVTVVYVIIDLIKTAVAPHQSAEERLSHYYPVIAVVLGIVTAIIMFYAIPESVGTENLLIAIAIGGASGLAAVGTNQMVKQLVKANVGDKND